jgi:hypothetical protein
MKTIKTSIILLSLLSFTNFAQVIKDTSSTVKKDSIRQICSSAKKKTVNIYSQIDTIGAAKDAGQNKSRSATPYELITPNSTEVKNYYVIRIVGGDKENNIKFYGLSLGFVHENQAATFSGMAFNFGLGNPPLQGKPDEDISINGINFSFFVTGTTGTINGFSFGGFWGNSAYKVNGISMGVLGTASTYLNGLALGGLVSGSKNANAIQVAGIMNVYCKFNGIGIALVNGSDTDSSETMINGLILGGYNGVNVNGLSIGVVNSGDSWLQIGIVNMGNSRIQIGLVNLDENYKMGIPLINVNF